ncbi:MAG TPA: MFS transporter [Marmoricola sp.]|nr:MFS transporter [Marmoricola sp.]
MSPTFRALAHRNYRLYATGGLVSNIGTWMQRVAQDWLVLVLSGNSGTALGITTGLQFLPILLLSPFAGAIADRFPKKRLLQLAQLMMAAPAVILGVLAVTGLAQQWHVYVIALMFGVATAFEAPVRQAFVGELVAPEDLSNAVGLNSASFNAGRIIGPGLAGLMIAAFGSGVQATGVVILLNAASYGAVLLALQAIHGDLPDGDERPERRGMIGDALRYVRGRPDLVLILGVMFFVGTFGLNFQLTSALMATEAYGKGAGEYGVLGSTMAIGSIVGALLSARRERPTIRLMLLSAVAFGVMEIVIALMPTYVTFVVLTPLIGITALTTITSANTIIQLSVPTELRGRVMALYLMVFMGGTPFGSPLIGWLGEEFGARWSLIGGGAMSILGTLFCVAVFLHLRAKREAPLPAPGAERLLTLRG